MIFILGPATRPGEFKKGKVMFTQKRIARLGTLLLVVLLGGLLLHTPTGVTSVQAQAPTDQPRTISVTGVGQVETVPDTAVFTVGVQNQAKSASKALTDNSTQMQAVINALKAAGVQASDIQTQTVNLQPQYNQQNNANNQLTGYVATNTVSVRVSNLSNLGELLDAAVKAGGNTIQNIQFEVSSPTQLVDQARQAAFNDAKQKATQLAQLAGATLGPVYTINENSQAPRPIFSPSVSSAERAAVPIQPGTQNVEVDLNITWTLQ